MAAFHYLGETGGGKVVYLMRVVNANFSFLLFSFLFLLIC